ncbi:Ger(x)C family spore germination protein [Cohnella suwonensis]|uniref:Ger(X)C family spore germination protein n=1 Tax=Cohnella suwonensis TaxID=696072 RepID=A0ABW0LUX8_9BACL
MKRSRILMVSLAIVLSYSLTGCWNRRELNELAIVLAAGIDLVDGGKYRVTVQAADPSQMGRTRAGNKTAGLIYTAEADTVFEAIRKMTTKAPRRMYFGHLQMLFVNEALARKGVSKPLDLMFRAPENRPDFNVAVTKGVSAEDVLAMISPFETIPAMDFYKSLKTSEKAWAPTSATRILDLMMQLSTDGLEPALTAITMIGNREGAKSAGNVKQPKALGEYQYQGLGAFMDDKLLGWMGEEDSKSYAYMTNRVYSTVGPLDCPQSKGQVTVEVVRAKSKIFPRIRNGEPLSEVKLRLEVNIGEVECDNINLTSAETFRQLERDGRKTIERIVGDGIRHVQQNFGTDIYGFGDRFHHKYPKQWRQWKDDWNKRFSRMPIELKVEYHIRRMGKITNPIRPAHPEEGK